MSEQRPSAGGEAGIASDPDEDRPTAGEADKVAERGQADAHRPQPGAPIISGNVGSLDDVPADVTGTPVVEE